MTYAYFIVKEVSDDKKPLRNPRIPQKTDANVIEIFCQNILKSHILKVAVNKSCITNVCQNNGNTDKSQEDSLAFDCCQILDWNITVGV